MSDVPSNVEVFYGRVDKRAKGWYWTDTTSEKPPDDMRHISREGQRDRG
jgi:hypothetical protein